ncbi:hypothetical protein K1T71_012809 [Dendrolimus kikuchii]|uniref:Uncharacterized protein n=1 Tax=Dendrolimus kikuchii TaxID=765133 RepID=A0ACC1CI56_9NEOP|nr:hypothetical protein K1T71_012809 [Dendrolimus kikuchii]
MEECTNLFNSIDRNYHLVNEAYNVAKSLFNQGRANYMALKEKSLKAIDTFLDLVFIMNNEMAKELRSAVLKFYKIRYFNDFTNYMITMEEIKDIVEHCLIDPVEKLEQIRTQFQDVIKNFEDIRNFDTVEKCYKELPDEVAATHCILHQGVLFNETMQESLVTIVETKTKQHAQDMNQSLHNVQKCLNYFVPKFFEQLLLDAYTSNCGYLRVVNASIADLVTDKWRSNETLFPEKWTPVVRMLKENSKLPTLMKKEKLIDSIYFLGNVTNSIDTSIQFHASS